MPLLPAWAPNVHPLIVHFPIAMLIVAAAGDVVDTVFGRPQWLRAATTALYVAGAAGAAVAVLTGQQAAATVLVPGMAHPVIEQHRTWAIGISIYFCLLAVVRLLLAFRGNPLPRSVRLALLVVALLGVAGLQQAAEHGARLVYEYGVGVIGSPGLR